MKKRNTLKKCRDRGKSQPGSVAFYTTSAARKWIGPIPWCSELASIILAFQQWVIIHLPPCIGRRH